MSRVDAVISRDLAAAEPLPWALEHVACDLCGSTDARELMQARDYRYDLPGIYRVVRCRACGLAYESPRPVLSDLMQTYPSEYRCHQSAEEAPARPTASSTGSASIAGFAQRMRTALARQRYTRASTRNLLTALTGLYAQYAGHILLPPVPAQGGRSLDVGCGSGWLVERCKQEGWEAFGIEPGHEAAERARRFTGRPVYEGTLPGVDLPESSFDAVTFWHVLEHVPSPLQTLRAAARLLRPGGALLVVVPNYASIERRITGERWFGLDLPRHLYHFEPESLRKLLVAAGLRPHQIKTHNEDWMFKLNLGRRFPRMMENPGFAAMGRLASRALSVVGTGSVIAAYCSK